VTVGIGSALWQEEAAVQLVVDKLEAVRKHSNDLNRYHEGWLPSTDPHRPHRVVVASASRDGISDAAVICANLWRSYPDLECIVFCGIAGGVPRPDEPTRHVRLGDVVVAEQIVSYGSVRRRDGANELRRAPGLTFNPLIQALKQLRIDIETGHQPWRAWLSSTDPRRIKFVRPPAETDVLYVGGRSVEHPDAAATGHEKGWPKVHYGTIGSADMLLRDEVERDRLLQSFNLMAVEMESTGLASAAASNNRGYFVVRGIVDYCENTGKNDVWHFYSSLAAAAFVRALLGACHPLGTDRPSASGLAASAQFDRDPPAGAAVPCAVPAPSPAVSSSPALADDRAAWWRGRRPLVLVGVPLLAASIFLPLRPSSSKPRQGTGLSTDGPSGFASAPTPSPVPSPVPSLRPGPVGGPGAIGTAPDSAGHETQPVPSTTRPSTAPTTTPTVIPTTTSTPANTAPATEGSTVTLQPIKWIKVTATDVKVMPDRDPDSDFEIEYNAVDPMHPGTVSYPNTDGTCTTPDNSQGRGIDPDATVTMCGTTRGGSQVKLRISKDPPIPLSASSR